MRRYTLTWWGWGVIAVALLAVSVVVLIRTRRNWFAGEVPIPLVVFLGSGRGIHRLVGLPRRERHRGTGHAGDHRPRPVLGHGVRLARAAARPRLVLRFILAGSLLFELVVALFVRHPVLPFWVDYPGVDPIPKLLYWSRNELFEVAGGGRIQGLVGNASTLGFIALLSLIVFGIQLAARTVWRSSGLAWMLLAVAVLLCTRSATITIALVAVALVAAAVLLLRRLPDRTRPWATLGLGAVAAGGVVAAIIARGPSAGAAGQERRPHESRRHLEQGDRAGAAASGRRLGLGELLGAVGAAVRRPAEGERRAGHARAQRVARRLAAARRARAHRLRRPRALHLRALLGVRRRPALVDGATTRYGAIELLPLLLLVALLVQSLAESRLLVEYGWTLLVIIAVRTRAFVGVGTRFSDRLPRRRVTSGDRAPHPARGAARDRRLPAAGQRRDPYGHRARSARAVAATTHRMAGAGSSTRRAGPRHGRGSSSSRWRTVDWQGILPTLAAAVRRLVRALGPVDRLPLGDPRRCLVPDRLHAGRCRDRSHAGHDPDRPGRR